MQQCFICGAEKMQVIGPCTECGEAWFCSEVHKNVHLSDRDGDILCSPFKVVNGKVDEGRYLVATRTINAGEVVMTDYPVLCGPIYTRSRPVCLNCLRETTSDSYRCSKCKYPVCNKDCETGRWHSMECPVFVSSDYLGEVIDCSTNLPLYSCITPLRLLLLQTVDPVGWRIVDSLMDHDDGRSAKDSPAWKVHELMMMNLVKRLNLPYTTSDIRRAVGILRTNSVKLDSRQFHGDGVALYPTYSYTNHSCVCNAHTVKYRDNHRLDLVAQSNIEKGQKIWTRYTTPQIGSFQRVQDIQKTWHFTCTCPRCEDPTEFGTMMSAVKCNINNCLGYMLPNKPTLVGSPWRCDTCSRCVGVMKIKDIIKTVLDQIGEQRQADNSSLLCLMENLSSSLHPNHYLIIGVKEIIIQRLMMKIRTSKTRNLSQISNKEKEEFLSDLRLRNSLFREMAFVMDKVDSKGSCWSEKLDKMEKEEKEMMSKIDTNSSK